MTSTYVHLARLLRSCSTVWIPAWDPCRGAPRPVTLSLPVVSLLCPVPTPPTLRDVSIPVSLPQCPHLQIPESVFILPSPSRFFSTCTKSPCFSFRSRSVTSYVCKKAVVRAHLSRWLGEVLFPLPILTASSPSFPSHRAFSPAALRFTPLVPNFAGHIPPHSNPSAGTAPR